MLKTQLVVSTVVLTPIVAAVALLSLPAEFTLPVPSAKPGVEYDTKSVKNWHMIVCVATGLWGGLLIGLQTEYFTSNRYQPVQVCAYTGGCGCSSVALPCV